MGKLLLDRSLDVPKNNLAEKERHAKLADMKSGQNPPKELKILLWGKTGVGKSTVGNAILGKNAFEIGGKFSADSVTTKCSRKTAEHQQQSVVVVDTPGLFHTQKNPCEVKRDLLECFRLLNSGPHVILLVVQPMNYTKDEDDKVLESFKEGFSDGLHHSLVLFTHDDKGQVEQFIEEKHILKAIINGNSDRYHVLSNPDIPNNTDPQDEALLKKMRKMAKKNEWKPYSNEMIEKILEKLSELESAEGKMSELEKKQLYALELLEKNVPGFPQLQKFLTWLEEWAMKFMPKD